MIIYFGLGGRLIVFGFLAITLILIFRTTWTLFESNSLDQLSRLAYPGITNTETTQPSSIDSPHKVLNVTFTHGIAWNSTRNVSATYFEQVYSVDKPPRYPYAAIREQCRRTKWNTDDIYLKCSGIFQGLTSIMSDIRVCFKMAFESGSGLILPSIFERDPNNLAELNFLNGEASINYADWFDVGHLGETLLRVCPEMKILHPDQLKPNEKTGTTPVKFDWSISLFDTIGYSLGATVFWSGRPFSIFFEEQMQAKLAGEFLSGQQPKEKGIITVDILAPLLLFSHVADPTGHDLGLWNDLSRIVRFRQEVRSIVNQLLSRLNRPFYGVHFRAENDTTWSSPEHQIGVDLDSLDKAWSMYGSAELRKPLIFLACGDADQVEIFREQGAKRGWEVTHKWDIARKYDNQDLMRAINALSFDIQGAVDMGVMLKSDFFMGITGSAFSMTLAHARDVTGRYRGSSFYVYDDQGARTHLNIDQNTQRWQDYQFSL